MMKNLLSSICAAIIISYAIQLNADRMSGNCKAGAFNGNGTMIDAKGNMYIGRFKGGAKYGNGTLYVSNGEIVRIGRWENGEFVGE